MSKESFKESSADDAVDAGLFSLGGVWEKFSAPLDCGKDGKGNGLTPSGRKGENPRHAEKVIDEL